MASDPQSNVFDAGLMDPPACEPATPDPGKVLARLEKLLARLRSADTMPLSEPELRMWTGIVPNMTKWLPEEQAERVRADFAAEMERLGGAT